MIHFKSRLGLLAVSAIAWAFVPSAHAQPVNDPVLRGAIDIHAHLDPDGFGPGHNGRAMDVLDMAKHGEGSRHARVRDQDALRPIRG